MIHPEEMTTTERAAYATSMLLGGAKWTTSEAAKCLGMSQPGAGRLLHRMSRVLPIARIDGVWKMTEAGRRTQAGTRRTQAGT